MSFEPLYRNFQKSLPQEDAGNFLKRLIPTNRFAIFGSLLLGVVIPEILHPIAADHLSWIVPYQRPEPMVLGAVAALLLSHWAIRRTSPLPFVDTMVVILPIFTASFAAVMIVMNLLIGSSTFYHLLPAFCNGVLWYSALTVMRARLGKPVIAFVGVSQIDDELQGTRVRWVPWASTRMPRTAQAIVYDSHKEYPPQWERFFARAVLRNIPVYDLDHIREMLTGRVCLRSKPELVFGQLLPSQPYLRIQRSIDLIGAAVLLIPALIIICTAGFFIRIGSPGPAFFRQTRVGYQGRLFTCYKLRTMRSDIPGPLYTTEEDPRITAIGRFLRKSRLDELPQIFNVIKGDMSWIGPRPEALRLSRAYERTIPFYSYRHSVRPGISGWAAVHQGNVALTDAVTRKLEYDFYYIKYYSFWLDFVIVMMTIRTMLTGFGSK